MGEKKTYLPLRDVEGVLAILNKISLLGGLSEKQLHFILGILREVSYRAGEYIFEKGDEPSHIYIIRSGNIKIVDYEDGTPYEIIEFGVGQCLGETAVIGIQLHSASAVAVEDTELIVLSREALLSIFDSDKELFSLLVLNVAREACRRLHQTDEIMLHYILRK
ncbi:MAG: cyclic nucleotide-binding domain-containing protein [Candidatus Omnitrophota bacterium]